jgi:two-component system alkaline phosphatase synthesis response regulator PhoP
MPQHDPVNDTVQTVLIVEDESTIAEILADNLEDEGYRTLISSDGSSGLQTWHDARPNLVILDVMLPHLSGYEICRTMRARGDSTPVLFLSAKGQADDRVQGLRAGGDDYLPKPFHLPEFLLRVENLLRRQRWGGSAGEKVETLRFGEVVSRDDILDTVWGDDAFPSSRTVDNFVMRLRRLFEPDPAAPVYFHTVWGVGYRFTPEGQGTETQ